MLSRNERRKYKLLVIALKVIPMLLSFCAALNTLLGYLGIKTDLLSLLAGVSLLPLLFLYLASYTFRFCRYHRMFLHYILVIELLNTVDYYVGISLDTRTLFIGFLLISFVFLVLILYFYHKEKCSRS